MISPHLTCMAPGLRQSLATAGMLIGSTIAAFTFAATNRNYIATFTVASIPPLLALIWMVQVGRACMCIVLACALYACAVIGNSRSLIWMGPGGHVLLTAVIPISCTAISHFSHLEQQVPRMTHDPPSGPHCCACY